MDLGRANLSTDNAKGAVRAIRSDVYASKTLPRIDFVDLAWRWRLLAAVPYNLQLFSNVFD